MTPCCHPGALKGLLWWCWLMAHPPWKPQPWLLRGMLHAPSVEQGQSSFSKEAFSTPTALSTLCFSPALLWVVVCGAISVVRRPFSSSHVGLLDPPRTGLCPLMGLPLSTPLVIHCSLGFLPVTGILSRDRKYQKRKVLSWLLLQWGRDLRKSDKSRCWLTSEHFKRLEIEGEKNPIYWELTTSN